MHSSIRTAYTPVGGEIAQGPKWVSETIDTPLVATKLLALYERLLKARSAGAA